MASESHELTGGDGRCDDLAGSGELRAVLDRYEKPLIAFASRIVGCNEAARDVVQETLIEFVSDVAPREPNRVAAWLFTVCRNRAISIRRKEKRVKVLTSEITDGKPADDPAPPAVLEQRDESERMLALVGELPGRQQEALRLRFHAGLSYREIADVLSTTTNNVGVLLHHALTRLREQMAIVETPSTPGGSASRESAPHGSQSQGSKSQGSQSEGSKS